MPRLNPWWVGAGLVVVLFWAACSSSNDPDGQDVGLDGLDVGEDGSDVGEDSGTDASHDAGVDAGDAGGGDLATADCQFDPSVTWFILGEILQMQSADQSTCVWMRRKNECPDGWICMAVPFSLLEIRIGHAGQVVEINDPAALSWASTHHNWEDVGQATANGTTYTLSGVQYGQQYELLATGAESYGPILLLPFNP